MAEAVKIDDVRGCNQADTAAQQNMYTSFHYCTDRTAQQKHPGRRILNGSTEAGFIADNKKCIESEL